MRRITVGSSMSAISSRRSPQRGHARTSKPRVRCISSTHNQVVRDGIGVARDDESTAVVPRSRVTAVSGSRACRCDRHADRAQHTVVQGQIDPRARRERRQPFEQLHRLEEELRGPIRPSVSEIEDDLPRPRSGAVDQP